MGQFAPEDADGARAVEGLGRGFVHGGELGDDFAADGVLAVAGLHDAIHGHAGVMEDGVGGVAAAHGEVKLGLGVEEGSAGGLGPGDEGVDQGEGPVVGPVVGKVVHGLADVAKLEDVELVFFSHKRVGGWWCGGQAAAGAELSQLGRIPVLERSLPVVPRSFPVLPR